MRHRLFIHLSWTTRDRAPLINLRTARFLEQFVPVIVRQERAQLLALGMVTTHVHLVLRVHPSTVRPRLLQRLKGGSSFRVTREGYRPKALPLRWDKGYNIQSVSERALDRVRAYVEGQASRHPNEAIPGWRTGSRSHPVALATSAESRL